MFLILISLICILYIPMIIKYRMFQQIGHIRLANVMKKATTISTFNGVNKIHHQQNMTYITKRLLKFKTMIKIPLVSNYTFFTVIAFSNINSFKKLIFIRLKKILIKKLYHLCVYIVISTIV